MLRNTLNCTLPIELVYNGEFEMNNVTCQRFEVGILCLPKAAGRASAMQKDPAKSSVLPGQGVMPCRRSPRM